MENLTLDQIDVLDATKAAEIITAVESNTKWDDTSSHVTTNGAKMNC